MKFDDDEYKFLKEEILELVRHNLPERDSRKLSFRDLKEAINQFIQVIKR